MNNLNFPQSFQAMPTTMLDFLEIRGKKDAHRVNTMTSVKGCGVLELVLVVRKQGPAIRSQGFDN